MGSIVVSVYVIICTKQSLFLPNHLMYLKIIGFDFCTINQGENLCSCSYVCAVEPPNADTFRTVKECPDQGGVLISGVQQDISLLHWDKTKCPD